MEHTVLLWPDGNPDGWHAFEPEGVEISPEGFRLIRPVEQPRLTFHGDWKLPDPKVLILPGGGYWLVAADHEGEWVAEWLARHGVPAAALTYRVPNPDGDEPKHRIPLQDATEAWRIVSALGATGVMGFSAGGHLAASLAHQEETVQALALIYPAYLLADSGAELLPEVAPLPHQTAFLVHHEHDLVPLQNSLSYFRAVQPASKQLHLLGGDLHGGGIRLGDQLAPWADDLATWFLEVCS
jgi:hypothetical protein